MNILLRFCFPILAITVISPLFAQTPSPAPIEVMILGTYHFANPGQDLHNMKVESVLTPARKAKLTDIAGRLGKFNPTKIAVGALPTSLISARRSSPTLRR